MFILAIPVGIAVVLEARYSETHMDWYWAIIAGAVMAIATALVGSIFLGLVAFLERKRRRHRQPVDSK